MRVELGPRDLAKGEFVAVRRDAAEKQSFKLANAVKDVSKLLDDIHNNLYDRYIRYINASRICK